MSFLGDPPPVFFFFQFPSKNKEPNAATVHCCCRTLFQGYVHSRPEREHSIFPFRPSSFYPFFLRSSFVSRRTVLTRRLCIIDELETPTIAHLKAPTAHPSFFPPGLSPFSSRAPVTGNAVEKEAESWSSRPPVKTKCDAT